MKRWLSRSATAGFALTLVAPLLSLSVPAYATGKLKCDVGIRNGADVAVAAGLAEDPIVYHNQSPSMHKHDFFGNTLTPQSAPGGRWSQLVNGSTICRLPGATASYWAPSLVYTSGPKVGQRVPVQQFTDYYRGFSGQRTDAGTTAFPSGVRLVASINDGHGIRGWTCGQNSTVTTGHKTIPDCSREDGSPGHTLTAHVDFPSCWNGVKPNHPGDPGRTGEADTEHGDTRDNADFAYPTAGACPAAFPIKVTQLRQAIQYAYTGDGTDVALTSDMGAPRGSTFHTDFWNTWKPGALEDFIRRCVQTAEEANCAP